MSAKPILLVQLVLVLSFAFAENLFSQTSDTQTASSFSRSGLGLIWTNAGNAASSDDSDAVAVGIITGGTTESLNVEDFNFAIPVGASINGIEVVIEKRGSASNSVTDANIQLLKAGVPVGDDASKESFWGTTDADYTYGSSSDLWGTTWEANQVNASDFGVSIQASAGIGLFPSIRIDFVQIAVHYTVFPIELLNFDAESIKNQVRLEWTTASETNNDYFQLERSQDNFIWEVITKVDGAGTTDSFRNYQHLDRAPNEGTSYYRLKNVDFSGRFDYSNIIQVGVVFQELDIILYVDEPTEALNVKFVSPSDFPVKGIIYDISGRGIAKISSLANEKIQLSSADFKAGIYYLKAKTYNGSAVKAFSIP